MKIAQIAPPWIAIPPPGYGGIEWIVSMLADGLAARGHEVTLFASGGSTTTAKLDSLFDAPGPDRIGDTNLEVMHSAHAYERAEEFDVIHDHNAFVGLAIGRRAARPVVHTVHGALYPDILQWYRVINEQIHLVSISDSQRAPAPEMRWADRIYNGIPMERYPYREDKEDFLLFVGRANHEKAPERAVQIAKKAGMPLKMAVAIKSDEERLYWETKVVPELTGDEQIVGEITVEQKADLMAAARALVFPIQWEEPFGLVMAEANACGTPVLACPRGAAPEVLVHGETGFLAEDVDELAAFAGSLDRIDPAVCRAKIQAEFSADVMVQGYERLFEQLVQP